MSFTKNESGGVVPPDEAALERAKGADLITLPRYIPGTNCGNCRFFDKGECKHPKVLQPVNDRMCCALWDAIGSIRPWLKD